MKFYSTSFITVFLLCVNVHQLYSQNCSATNAGSDQLYCGTGSVTIGSSAVSGYSYSWSPTTGLNNPNIAQPSASPSGTTTYTLTQLGSNLLSNPGFESGNTGFSSDYSYCPTTSCTSGFYNILGSVYVVGYCSTNPHTGSNLFLAWPPNSNPSSYRVWYQSVNVSAGAIYRFSGFIARMADVAINYDVVITGNNSGTVTNSFSTSAGCGSWNSFSVDWTAGGSDTQVTIEIKITNSGNTVWAAFDDLSFGCKSTDDVTVQVGGTPSVIPGGPIAYYNQYETPNSIDLTYLGIPPGTGTWYKNNVSTGVTGAKYTVNFSGNSTYTDYYKVRSACGVYSNTVTFNYIGCDNDNDYPVGITHGGCASSLTSPNYIQLNAQSLGQGTTYSYWTYYNPSNYNINSSGHLTGQSSWGSDGVYVKSAKNGGEIYMFYTIVGNAGCRGIPGREPGSQTVKPSPSITIAPNPAGNQVRITSRNSIRNIEIYNMVGERVRRFPVNDLSFVLVNTSGLPAGMYSVRVLGENGHEETSKLIIQR